MADLRAVTLDAVGTLIELAEPVGTTYARFAARHGIPLTAAELERGFRTAFAAAPPLAFPGASPLRLADHERAWWYTVVRRAFGPAGATPTFDACFAELFAHYAAAGAWRVFPDVPAALERLRRRGFRLGVVSNFDARLVPILAALGLTPLVDTVTHSTDVGVAKPDPAIFAAALGRLGVPPTAALHVGDREDADVEGARAAGMQAVLLDRTGRPASPGVAVIGSLTSLADLVAAG